MVKVLTVVADREKYNLEAIIWHLNRHFNVLKLGGVIVPFSDLDFVFPKYIMKYRNVGKHGYSVVVEQESA